MDLGRSSDAVLLNSRDDLLCDFVLHLFAITLYFVLHEDIGACVWYLTLDWNAMPLDKLGTFQYRVLVFLKQSELCTLARIDGDYLLPCTIEIGRLVRAG